MVNSKVILILGMHRSGTSCLAGSLQEMGLYLGTVNTAAPHNAKGNRENRAIMDLHNTILQDNGGSWDAPPEKVTWQPQHYVRRDEIIETYYPPDQAWGFKDPRTLLTLPGWLAALSNPQFVGTFRHPWAVAESLRTRNKFAQSVNYSLWLTYNQLLLSYQRQFGFELICFDWPPERYQEKLIQIGNKLDLATPTKTDSFFTSALRRNQPKQDPQLPEPVNNLYRQLEEIAA